jgi:hypothetical protein
LNFTEQQILQLAPDDASVKAGKGLASQANWLVAAHNERVLWGEIKGSGSKPYLTQIDLQNLAFKCSCPSRKFPCKHGLGLMLLSAAAPASISNNPEEPAWVSEWMNKRGAKAEKLEETTDKEVAVDEKAREKRESDRLKAVEAGMADLDLVLNDLIRHGLMHLSGLSPDFFSNLAKRMVDAKATGLANRIESLDEWKYAINQQSVQDLFLQQVADLHFLIQSFRNRQQLDDIALESLKVSIGWNQAPKALIEDKSVETVKDFWLVAGQHQRERDNMKIQTTYLFGRDTQRSAQILQFSFSNQAFELLLPVGNELLGGLVFFSHLIPFRAAIRLQLSIQPGASGAYKGWSTLAEAVQAHTNNLTLYPLHFETLGLIHDLRIAQMDNRFVVADMAGQFLPLEEDVFPVSKQIDWLTKTEGKACTTILIIRAKKVIPLGVFVHAKYYPL